MTLMALAGLLTLLASYVRILTRWLTPQQQQGPEPLDITGAEITPDTWNPPGAKAYAALKDGPSSV